MTLGFVVIIVVPNIYFGYGMKMTYRSSLSKLGGDMAFTVLLGDRHQCVEKWLKMKTLAAHDVVLINDKSRRCRGVYRLIEKLLKRH